MTMIRPNRSIVAVALAASLALPAAAQTAPEPDQPDSLEGVVVTAQRIGVPVWRVGEGASMLILVGHIEPLPSSIAWRPEALEQVVEEADTVIFPPKGSLSPADVARIFWRMRSIVFLPKGKTLADYVDAPTLARLEALRAQGATGEYMKFNPWTTAEELMESTGVEEKSGPDAADVVRKAVRRNRKKRENVTVVTGKQVLDAYFNAGPAAHVPCLKAAITAAEAGRPAAARRIDAYVRNRVAEVVRSPVEQALNACWPLGGEPIASSLRAQWRTTILQRAGRPGVTLAVVPLLHLAEDGGVLDALAAQGRSVEGPRWREGQP